VAQGSNVSFVADLSKEYKTFVAVMQILIGKDCITRRASKKVMLS
jgi:hypothetical protein